MQPRLLSEHSKKSNILKYHSTIQQKKKKINNNKINNKTRNTLYCLATQQIFSISTTHNLTSYAILTLTRSGSPIVERNSPMQEWSKPSMGCGWSDMVYLRAVTTVLRMKADSAPRLTWSLGRSVCGCTRASFPTHSATTFLVPSSALSKC